MANYGIRFQAIGGNLYFPRQHGLIINGQDLFEAAVKKKPPNALFVEDWDYYHSNGGDVHCGSYVKRKVPGINWWELIP